MAQIPDEMRVFRLIQAKHAIGLEAKGLKHSSGRSVKALWARKFDLPTNCKHQRVIDRINEELKEYGWKEVDTGAEREVPPDDGGETSEGTEGGTPGA